ncbi:MAG: hypothetical protein HOD43_01735 [Candidatus Marinimicrobia bacterium]|nr:hypothetical protein [Candidatus Neomarinimicrobiota bacterium]MBT3630195.1 hypothetical protein [Candidatus Neomarinimicrobiota bacterium]MBT3826147.1 hypothetical protein [Candidatus Neomarinimicrobiota bacterium]MBT4132181.1 hypothetical protein [Candidatus Neomarinimicrobiota bacterium]MBT4294510.1 hypothetical protein [Candidatus Neomarinimicrobiota bacterium]
MKIIINLFVIVNLCLADGHFYVQGDFGDPIDPDYPYLIWGELNRSSHGLGAIPTLMFSALEVDSGGSVSARADFISSKAVPDLELMLVVYYSHTDYAEIRGENKTFTGDLPANTLISIQGDVIAHKKRPFKVAAVAQTPKGSSGSSYFLSVVGTPSKRVIELEDHIADMLALKDCLSTDDLDTLTFRHEVRRMKLRWYRGSYPENPGTREEILLKQFLDLKNEYLESTRPEFQYDPAKHGYEVMYQTLD